MTKAYCVPWNAGLQSETGAVCRRIGRLMTALDTEINSNIAQGEIVEHIRNFRFDMLTRLEREGWTLSYDGTNNMKVRQPGHRKPFLNRTKHAEQLEAEHKARKANQ
jgi:hypothetical protein